MTLPRHTKLSLSAVALLMASTAPALAQDVRIVQPGAPGTNARVLSAEEAAQLAGANVVPADIEFMQNMIVHHQQAVEMAALVDGRTNNPTVLEAASRIATSQQDEMAFMSEWLTGHGAPVANAHAAHMGHEGMVGMATEAQMAELAAASGTDFDRMFFMLMARHHAGALTMVQELVQVPGAATDPALYPFAVELYQGQQAEITRLNTALAALSDDPRVGLAGGLFDAETAISNLRQVAELKKPDGFFDPDNPSGANQGPRGSFLSFANTDMAFSGDLMVAGSYHGWNAYRLDDEGMPQLVSSVVCPGGQGDVSIVGDILIMSVESNSGRRDCGTQGISEDVSMDRFRGLRIFDISDITAPVQVGQVQTCRGSHTHSVVRSDAEKIVVYNSGTAGVRSGEELAGCISSDQSDPRTSLFSIDVIEIPLANPAASRIVSSPRVFADDEGNVAGLWQGGDHGMGTQSTNITNQCHDITVFPSKNLAAGACSGNGIIMDISDPYNPVRLDAVTDPGFAYWHSATFNNDGSVVLFTDEWGGGGGPRCQAADPMNFGADAFYEIVDNKLERRGTYKLPAAQSALENCVAHNGSIIPVPGRNIFVQAWYQGGLSVIDFTDPNEPFEIAYFDRGPVNDEQFTMGGYWSVYWYNGKIYATEIARGLDVFELTPSEYLTQEEIDAAVNADMGETFNPQTQYPVTWSQEQVRRAERSRSGG